MSATRTGLGAAYDRRMTALMNRHSDHPWIATAARRRAAVALHVALTVAGLGTTWVLAVADGETVLRWTALALLVLLVPWCYATGFLNSATRGLLELRARVLDERQLAERARVQARAHRLTLYLLLLACGGAAVVDVPQAAVAPGLASLVAFHWLMPLWLAGLSVQDVAADDV
ncbi:hypothetical protein ACFV3R_07855 [Streptomyces sp. NPDC059740]|uniref:hypothetical protein n=1 Tax=Streptomyces sp. NPDC059740 TaxID=3346926 RepID=UPI00365F2283